MRITVLVWCALVASACGADGTQQRGTDSPQKEASASGAETMPGQEWSERVSDRCVKNASRAGRAVLRLQKELRTQGWSRDEFVARVLETSIKTTRPLLDDAAALPAPSGREADAERFFSLLRSTFPLIERSARAVRENNAAASRRINRQILEVAVPARALARELEIPECIPRASAS